MISEIERVEKEYGKESLRLRSGFWIFIYSFIHSFVQSVDKYRATTDLERRARCNWLFCRVAYMWPSARTCMQEQRLDPSICRLFWHWLASCSFDFVGKMPTQVLQTFNVACWTNEDIPWKIALRLA